MTYTVVFPSCAQVQHQNKLQRVLWELVSEMEVVAPPPDPTTLAHHRLVVSQTLCRTMDVTSGRLIDGEVVFSSPAHVEKRNRVEKLLAFLNGVWRSDSLIHHCVRGMCCCKSEDEAKANTCAALVENGATPGSDTNLPSSNRWGSCTATAAGVAAFSMCHAFLPLCLVKAFPDWTFMLSRANDGADEHRVMIRKKAWRACHVLDTERRKCRICLAAAVSIPIDALMARLQYFDERGDTLLDIVEDSTSPLVLCGRSLAAMLQGPGSPTRLLGHVLRRSAGVEQASADVRAMLLNLSAQLRWRLGGYDHFPLKLALCEQPRCSGDARERLVRSAFEIDPCCLDEHFTLKLGRLFGSPQELLQNGALRSGLRLWASVGKTTNMHIERQLAQVIA